MDAIQTRAIEMGFSSQGEMFSVENMKTLAETLIDDLSGDETSLTASEFELNVIDSIFLTDPKR